jgi:hypothetical protein
MPLLRKIPLRACCCDRINAFEWVESPSDARRHSYPPRCGAVRPRNRVEDGGIFLCPVLGRGKVHTRFDPDLLGSWRTAHRGWGRCACIKELARRRGGHWPGRECVHACLGDWITALRIFGGTTLARPSWWCSRNGGQHSPLGGVQTCHEGGALRQSTATRAASVPAVSCERLLGTERDLVLSTAQVQGSFTSTMAEPSPWRPARMIHPRFDHGTGGDTAAERTNKGRWRRRGNRLGVGHRRGSRAAARWT